MVQPVSTLTLGGTDISSYVSDRSSDPISFGRGASFDGGQEAPGWLTAVVQNPDRRFNPLNSGSPFASILKFGKKVRLISVHSATTRYHFDGYLRRIIQRDDGFAELRCQDALYNFAQKEVSLASSFTRSVGSFRAAILADIGYSGTSLASANGGESMVGYTAADQANALALLTELNAATGTVHYLKPTAAGADYTTIDRTTFQKATSSEDWLDTDLTAPFATSLGGTEYSDDRIINSQRVQARPRALTDNRLVVWSKRRWTVNASSTEDLWAQFDDPILNPTISYTTKAGSPTVTVAQYGRSAKISVTAGGTAVDLREVELTAKRFIEDEVNSRRAEDATSISTYGRYEGAEIASDFIPNEAHSYGLAAYTVWRNKDATLVPSPTFVNRFPTQLVREIGDVVRITSTELSTTLGRFVIRGHEHTIDSGEWRTTYTLESLPAAMTLFTIGGTAGEGIGGTGILGY